MKTTLGKLNKLERMKAIRRYENETNVDKSTSTTFCVCFFFSTNGCESGKTMEKCYRKGSLDSWFKDKDTSIALLLYINANIHTDALQWTEKKPTVIGTKTKLMKSHCQCVCVYFPFCTMVLSRLDKAVEICEEKKRTKREKMLVRWKIAIEHCHQREWKVLKDSMFRHFLTHKHYIYIYTHEKCDSEVRKINGI